MSEESGWRRTKKDFRDAPASPERRQPADVPEIYEFGCFRLEPAERKLLRGDEVVALTPKAFDTLHLLVRNSGHLLEKDALIRLLWPDSVVEEGNLTNNIFLLRKVLGEDAEYIETVPRKGYRFIGAVRALPKAERVRPEAAKGAGLQDPPDVVVTPVPSSAPRLGRVIAGVAATALVMLAVGGAVWWRFGSHGPPSVEAPSPSRHPANIAPSNAVAFSPPSNSIAVLPFVNLSGDKEQEYFSDGLTEELLNSLAHIDGLQVAARTSSFSFREHPDIAEVAHKLNVATVLEGSVRRSGHTVRISAKLINAVTGFHLWSKTYDRDLADVLRLQTEIATAVATALEVTLLADVSAKIELGGTRNPVAFDAYLRASKVAFAYDVKDIETAIAGYTEAIRLDPNYALAFAYRSLEWTAHAEETYGGYAKGPTIGEDDARALADARQAVTLAPQLAEGHLALAFIFQDRTLDFPQTKVELERAIALAPGNAHVLGWYGRFAAMTGRTDAGIAAARRAVVLDPLNLMTHYRLGQTLYAARRFAESVMAFSHVLALDPQAPDGAGIRGLAYYALGDLQNALASCEAGPDNAITQSCLALSYHRLERHAEAEARLAELTAAADRWAYLCAAVYAQWGNPSRALDYLELDWRLRNPHLRWLKADPLMDPLRKEPRFQAIEKALKFPD